MNRLRKCFITTCFMLCIFAFPLIAQAATGPTIQEVEPNNSTAEATEIQRNLMTPQEVAAGDLSGRRGARGTVTATDSVDYFKVLLYSDKENILDFGFSSGYGAFSIQVCDINDNLVLDNSFTYSRDGEDNAFRVSVPTMGNYYIKVTSLTPGADMGYNFTIGNPLYFISKHVVNFPSITLGPSLPAFEESINLAPVPTIQNRSIAYNVLIGGGTTSTTSSRKLCNESNSRWLTAINSIWDCKTPVIDDYRLQQEWIVQYNGGSRNATFRPEVTFYYVYPHLPLNEQF